MIAQISDLVNITVDRDDSRLYVSELFAIQDFDQLIISIV